MMDFIYSWEHAVIAAYKPIPYHKGWKKCKKCHEIPRLWRFDNGCFASCRCKHMYDSAQVRVESIMSYASRHNGSVLDYWHDGLRVAWNRYVETGETQTKLPEGQW